MLYDESSHTNIFLQQLMLTQSLFLNTHSWMSPWTRRRFDLDGMGGRAGYGTDFYATQPDEVHLPLIHIIKILANYGTRSSRAFRLSGCPYVYEV